MPGRPAVRQVVFTDGAIGRRRGVPSLKLGPHHTTVPVVSAAVQQYARGFLASVDVDVEITVHGGEWRGYVLTGGHRTVATFTIEPFYGEGAAQ
jgi:hypothetical protein